MAINKNRESKDSSIKIRISATEKAEYQKKAARYGTTLTNYILLKSDFLESRRQSKVGRKHL